VASLPRATRNRGVFRLAEARAAGLHPEQVRRLTRQGELTRLGRGLYAPATFAPSEHHTLAEVAKRVPADRAPLPRYRHAASA
jgi:hypothetical protein